MEPGDVKGGYNPKPVAKEVEENPASFPYKSTMLYKPPLFQKQIIKPMFRDSTELSLEQLTDPDYRLNQIEKLNSRFSTTCSRCHHCR